MQPIDEIVNTREGEGEMQGTMWNRCMRQIEQTDSKWGEEGQNCMAGVCTTPWRRESCLGPRL